MISKLQEEAKKEGKLDQLQNLQQTENEGVQIAWRDQVNPNYNQNELFEIFIDPQKQIEAANRTSKNPLSARDLQKQQQ